MQVAWFERQNWLEVRNAQPELFLFDGHRFQSTTAIYSHAQQHIYQLGKNISAFRIDDVEYFLDASLRVQIEDDVVTMPPMGNLRIRIYSERECRWWLLLCSAGEQDIFLKKYQQEFGWCYVQVQWWVDQRIGPNSVAWIPPKKQTPIVVEAGKKDCRPYIYFHHEEKGDFALQWYRQPLLSHCKTEKNYLWVDELGAEIDVRSGMVGDRFIIWSPVGWSFVYRGEETSELILERRPAIYSDTWIRVQHPYRSVERESYNACLLRGCTNLVVHSPMFSSWVARDRKASLCSHLIQIDGENLSGDLLWRMNHV